MDHGTRRRFQRLTNDDGVFCVAAVDHRDALVAEFAAHGGPGGADAGAEPSPEVLTTFKADVLGALGDRPSAVMNRTGVLVPPPHRRRHRGALGGGHLRPRVPGVHGQSH